MRFNGSVMWACLNWSEWLNRSVIHVVYGCVVWVSVFCTWAWCCWFLWCRRQDEISVTLTTGMMTKEGSFHLTHETHVHSHSRWHVFLQSNLSTVTLFSHHHPCPTGINPLDVQNYCMWHMRCIRKEVAWLEQHEAPIITSNGFIFENHIRS